MKLALLFAAGVWAGAQNALAGGGSFVTLPALLLAGLDARAANITSTLALFPGQAATGYLGRGMVGGVGALSVRALLAISLAGGAAGAVLLLLTPGGFFERLLPFLVLFATAVFVWGSFARAGRGDGADPARMGPLRAGAAQFAISVYGGYFGGGIGFLMLAALTVAGVAVRKAAALKNLLAGAMNASAVVIFATSHDVAWTLAAVLCAGALVGGWAGVWMLSRIPTSLLRGLVVVVGAALTLALFAR